MKRSKILLLLFVAASVALLCAGIVISQDWLTSPQVTGTIAGARSSLCYTTDNNGYMIFREHYNNHKLIAAYNPANGRIVYTSTAQKNKWQELIALSLSLKNKIIVQDYSGFGSWGGVPYEFLNR